MKKIQKVLSLVLAVVMVMSMGVVSASATGDFVPTNDGYYESDSVVAYQYYTPASTSMCNGVFSAVADVTIDGEWATLHLYVANPTPGSWGGLADGILTNPTIYVDGTAYVGELTSIGYENPNADVRYFSQDSSFFGITAGDELACDTMKFVIPAAALASNLHIEAFVNLVMNSPQDFWLDINWVENADVDTDVDTDVEDSNVISQNVEVSATVPVTASTYSVSIPESIEVGELNGEFVYVDVEIDVTIDSGNDGLAVLVGTDSQWGTLTNGVDTIEFEQYMGRLSSAYYVYSSGTVYDHLYFYEDATEGVSAGTYTGTLTYNISSTTV